jgi:hypothetical protein
VAIRSTYSNREPSGQTVEENDHLYFSQAEKRSRTLTVTEYRRANGGEGEDERRLMAIC